MSDFDVLKSAVTGMFADRLPIQERIREYVDRLRPVFPAVTDEEAEELIRWFETVHGVRMTDGAMLREAGFEPWLENARAKLDPYYWDRYRKFLINRGFSSWVLATLDSVTDRILGLLENPDSTGRWDRRGMVMGHVQSGKTANYTGLICKAADAGYRVIIIIAGIHNNLRNQTQRRIDEGLVGFDSIRTLRGIDPTQNLMGVGYIDTWRRPSVFTSSQRDFSKAIADNVRIPLQNLSEPAVFVIKKNANTLKNLIEWLTAQNTRHGTSTVHEPMLLIDDEADNASINIRHEQDEISRINGQIRQLLRLFDRSCYVGYTATPFANIFVDPDSEDEMLGNDLFPRDFIVSLDPPDNYFGASRVFIDEPEHIVRSIDDHADLLSLKHPIHHRVIGLPETLETAVRVFIVARAIRLARGQIRQHNSMLVNVSRFVDVQRQVRNEIHALVDRIRSSVRINGELSPDNALRDPEIAALFEAFRTHYENSCGLPWSKVQTLLHESISPVNVVEVNSRAPGSLDYVKYEKIGLNVIAVGGFSLSRGLTLEGLVISYFLRNSMMYDTLLQMGRWFGYRNGYADLCRVWMPEEAQGWYTHITESIDELREELTRMQSINATPKDFGLRVRSHPDTLVVTARNKMGSGRRMRVLIGLSNSFVETAILRRDPPSLETNRKAAISLAANLRRKGFPPEGGEEIGGGRLVRRVPVGDVDTFLMAFRNHEGSVKTQTKPVRSYIRERQTGELAEWDIFFPGLATPPPQCLVDSSLGFELVCQRRAPGLRSDASTLMITNKQRVSSRGIEKTGLTEEQSRGAQERYDEDRHSTGPPTNYPDRIYRQLRTRPLLVVHMLAIGNDGDDLSREKPIVA